VIGGCHCFCALFNHLGVCNGMAVTTRLMGEVDIPMCVPCTEAIDARRAEDEESKR
jgi:hypothetical protein